MNARLLVTALVGAAAGAAAVSFGPPREAHAQAAAGRQRWEYKVLYCPSQLPNDQANEDKLGQLFNDLAKDGWEYAGPVADRTFQPGQVVGGYVAFKRPKSERPPPPIER
jgi:hypothetical protein